MIQGFKRIRHPTTDGLCRENHLLARCGRRDAFHEDCISDAAIGLAIDRTIATDCEARQAISFLRTAGDIANKYDDCVVTEDHVGRAAENGLYTKREVIFINQPAQKQMSLYAVAAVAYYADRDLSIVPGPVAYRLYK